MKTSIVKVKVQIDCPRGLRPSKKEHHYGEAVYRSSGMALAFSATTPPRELLWKGLTKGGIAGF
jgi:hypothetical protein